MTDLLNQALTLTVWGMGMTFTAIGALAIGMVLLTAWSRDKAKAEGAELFESEPEADIDIAQSDREYDVIEEQVYTHNAEELNLAAAAGVAVALAMAQESAGQQNQTPPPVAVASAWVYFVRGRHLSQRSHFVKGKRK